MEHDVSDKSITKDLQEDDAIHNYPVPLLGRNDTDKMEKDVFHTPANTHQLFLNKRVAGSLCTIDSGFSERSSSVFSSSLSQESATLSASGSQTYDVEDSGVSSAGGAQSSPDNSFSPISHLPVTRKARRLRFHPFIERPPAFQLPSSLSDDEDDVAEVDDEGVDKGDSTVLDLKEYKADSIVVADSVEEMRTSSIGNSGATESSSSGSLSSSTDDLELSLQEMSLEECSSGSSSSLSTSPSNQRNNMSQQKSSSSQPDLDLETREALSSMSISPPPPPPSTSPVHILEAEESSAGDAVATYTPQEQQAFLKSLSLTRKHHIHQEPSTDELATEHRLPRPEARDESRRDSQIITSIPNPPKKDSVLICNCGSRSSPGSRVPPLPHEYISLSDCPSAQVQSHHSPHHVSAVGVGMCCDFDDLLKGHELLKSPSKRNSSRTSPDQEFMSLRSPSKARKTHKFSPRLSGGKTKRGIRSPSKKAREKNSIESGAAVEKRRNVKRSIFGVETLEIDLEHDTSQWLTSENGLDTQLIREKALMGLFSSDEESEGVRETGVQLHDPSKQSSKGFHSSGEAVDTEHDKSCKFYDPNLRLVQVIEKFSPRVPSSLIGQHTGVLKFDVVGELSSRNFLVCVQRILGHLTDIDLDIVCKVSRVWKFAVLSDPQACYRYKLYRTVQNKLEILTGKENAQEKSADSAPHEAMTASKGLLTSVQPQATHRQQSPPSQTQPQVIELLSDDKLRCCPHCQSPAKVMACQDRAVCSSEVCGFDFCTMCFAAFHASRRCKPLCSAPARKDFAGSRKSRKNLRRL